MKVNVNRSSVSLAFGAGALALAQLLAPGYAQAQAFSQAPASPAAPAPKPAVQDETFNINSFAVSGNTILSNDVLLLLVTPFTGEKRVYGDIQKALEALEGGYRIRGFSAVQVFVPEQTLDTGIVKLTVIEAKIANIKIEGHAFYDEANIRAALPALQKGLTPNARDIAANVRVANESPARQVDVVLGAGDKEDEVNASVTVTDSRPLKFTASADNTGSAATGLHRLSLAFSTRTCSTRTTC